MSSSYYSNHQAAAVDAASLAPTAAQIAIAGLAGGVFADAASDLASADRIAYIRARRTGQTHLVIATTTSYVIIQHDVPAHGVPSLATIATPDGMTPILTNH